MEKTASRFERLPAAGFLAFSLALLGSNASQAQPMPNMSPEHCAAHSGEHAMHAPFGASGSMHEPTDGLPHFLKGVELTEAQRDKIFELRHAQAPHLRELMKAVRQSKEALHAQSSGDNLDLKLIRSLADKHAKAVADMIVAHAETGAKIRALLTTEQKKQTDDAKARMKDRHQHGPHRAVPPS